MKRCCGGGPARPSNASGTHEPEPARALAGERHGPVFLIGAPRSGTSLLYKSLALHEGFGYISNYNERLPRWSAAAA